MVVSAITQVDPYNPEDQSGFLRYLIGTEGGEIYMIAFQIEILREITKDGRNKNEQGRFNALTLSFHKSTQTAREKKRQIVRDDVN